MPLLKRIAISHGHKARAAAANAAITTASQTKIADWNRHLQAELRRKQTIQSALLVVNEPAGTGRTPGELSRLQSGFHQNFAPIPRRVFTVAAGHDEVTQLTQAFLKSFSGPWLLLSGGGGGTSRALVQGLLAEVELGTVRVDDVQVSALRLGSGNLLPRHLGLPREPAAAMQRIADDLFAGRHSPCCVYRCTCRYPTGQTWVAYGLTMAGLGQFGRVPDDIKHWREKHAGLMHWAARRMPLESVNTFQYVAFSLVRAGQCILHPSQAELVEVRHDGRRERFRLFSGVLLNFDFPQLPFQGGCAFDEPRLVLALIPQAGHRQSISTLLSWPRLDQHVHKYEITPDRPLEMRFLENQSTVLALDEDTFNVPNRISFEVATLIKFVSGSSTGSGRNR